MDDCENTGDKLDYGQHCREIRGDLPHKAMNSLQGDVDARQRNEPILKS
jgi:hypothetical protein